MSRRLQVLLDEQEIEQIRAVARRNRLTVAEWVRRALRNARQEEPLKAATLKLTAVRKAAQYSFPTADIEKMTSEIAQGYQD